MMFLISSGVAGEKVERLGGVTKFWFDECLM